MLKSTSNPATTPRPKAKIRKAGFTIVEVAIAATILAFALCSCFGVMNMSFRMLDDARTSTLAAQVMQSEIERLRMLNWSDLNTLVTTTPSVINIANDYATSSTVAQRFTATRLITPTVGREASMIDIQVSVSWKGISGAPHTRTFKTKYSKNGLNDYFYTARTTSS